MEGQTVVVEVRDEEGVEAVVESIVEEEGWGRMGQGGRHMVVRGRWDEKSELEGGEGRGGRESMIIKRKIEGKTWKRAWWRRRGKVWRVE